MLRRASLLLLVLGSGLSSCTYDNAEELLESKPLPACAEVAVTYSGTISPILDRNCRSCHNQLTPQANVNLEGYARVKPYADNGLLVGVSSHAPGFIPMPVGAARLSDCDIASLKTWVAAGAPDN
ncbi:hypothetical protein GCM10022408_16920 [Hymenobacter fastidiosus]|uniref:Cytochrome c domain-containing protein n=1 Tax=Hymenobacter fastidiosus TaxID=486264 RepID=A0ABP7S2I2_9BACT